MTPVFALIQQTTAPSCTIGSTFCKKCKTGGYCPHDKRGESDGGYTKCLPGFYNDQQEQHLPEACKPCEEGTYSDKEGKSLFIHLEKMA